MLKEERQQKILEILDEEQRVIASDLSQRFSVSEDTIRRDLKELDQKELIRRVHSGALRIGPPVTDFEKRQKISNDSKEILAKKALPYIRENTVILIDGSTTNLHLVNLLPINLKATIITNSPPIAMALAYHEQVEVLMIGGTLYKQSMVNLGIDTIEYLNNIRVDLYVMGIYNIDDQIGISVPSISEALVKRKMISISTEIMGLVTLDKLGTVSNQIIAPANVLTYLVTEDINLNISKLYAKQKIIVVQ
ncbi:MAG: DeoR/GlpR transcriptional regulator [Sebaldella sp.]|nr:DeoR/GlpR transcriptional regulator [Sebaldella sp.]